MTKQEEIRIEVNQVDIRELGRILDSIIYVDVTFGEDMLLMAQQALRLTKMRATEARNMVYKWEGVI